MTTAHSQPGHWYDLGPHRLWCGDVFDMLAREDTDLDHVGVLVYDPPWQQFVPPNPWLGLGYSQSPPSVLAFTDGQRGGDVIRRFGAFTWLFTWDTGAAWNIGPKRPLKATKLCMWYGDLDSYDRDGAMWGEPADKRRHPTTTFDPDPRGRRLTDLYRCSLRWFKNANATGSATNRHPHEKPLDWIRCLIGNTSTGLVFDPFAGSGTSLEAAADLGRPSINCEINPAHCDTIRRRWTAWAMRHGIDPGPDQLAPDDAALAAVDTPQPTLLQPLTPPTPTETT